MGLWVLLVAPIPLQYFRYFNPEFLVRVICINQNLIKWIVYAVRVYFVLLWYRPILVVFWWVTSLALGQRLHQWKQHWWTWVNRSNESTHDDVIKWNIFRVTGHLLVPSEFPAQRPVTRSFDVFFDLRLNKRLSKQSWGWWFDKLSRPL